MAAPGQDNGKGGAPQKLKVLCLHGYLQNAEVFRAKAGSLRKGLKSRADFHFVDAPHPVTSSSAADVSAASGSQEQPRGWWTWQDKEPGMRPSLASTYAGWEEALAVLVHQVEELQPDAILGFSQGATAAALLLAHLRSQQPQALPKCAILIAGFLPRDERFAGLLQAHPPGIPLLIVHGQADALVPMERSQQLQEALQGGASAAGSVQRFEHPGAHMVPSCSGAFKQLLQAFLDGHTPQP